jgi:hypothetical protein
MTRGYLPAPTTFARPERRDAPARTCFIGRDIVLRTVKPHAEAEDRLYVGRALECDRHFVAVDGYALAYGRPTPEDPSGGVVVSRRARSFIPVSGIECIEEAAAVVEEGGPLATIIARLPPEGSPGAPPDPNP